MDIQAISTAIHNALVPLNIRVYDYAPDAPSAPAAFIYPTDFTYHDTFSSAGEMTEIEFVVRLLVSSVAMQGGQQLLNNFISTSTDKSAVAAIELDPTLGGVVDSTEVTKQQHYGVLNMPDGLRYLSAELVISVYVSEPSP